MPEAIEHRLVLSAPPDDVNIVHTLLERVWAESPDVAEADRHGFETALIELVSNVVRHAHDGEGVVADLRIIVRADAIEACMTDTGSAGDISVGESTMPSSSAEGGRGIPIINALVDALTYERDGEINRWTMRRSFEG